MLRAFILVLVAAGATKIQVIDCQGVFNSPPLGILKRITNDLKKLREATAGVLNIADIILKNNNLELHRQMDNNYILLQKRKAPFSMAMNRTWYAYRWGFKQGEEYWWGLERIYRTIEQEPGQWKLRIEVTDENDNKQWLEYEQFVLESEANNYRFLVNGKVEGTMGDALRCGNYPINGMPFTTLDKDNDKDSKRNCAIDTEAGWWHQGCSVNKKDSTDINHQKFPALRRYHDCQNTYPSLKETKILMKLDNKFELI